MTTKNFDLRMLSLLIPACASGLGFFCFGILAFSFTELTALPAAFRTALVLIGAISLAFGAEVGTLTNVVEIYRKGDKLAGWDKLALGISLVATVGAFVLSFATLLGVTATWGDAVKRWGPIALGLFAALDSYGGFMELGIYTRRMLADKQAQIANAMRFELWQAQTAAAHKAQMADILAHNEAEKLMAQLQAAQQENAQVSAQLRDTNAQLDAADALVKQLQAQVAVTQAQPADAPAEPATAAPKASKQDWRTIVSQQNGKRAILTRADWCALIEAAGLSIPSARTLDTWISEARQ